MTREEIEEKMHEAAEEIKPLVTTLVEALCKAHQKGYLAGVELGVNIGHPHWIPVEEMLPVADGRYIIADKYGGVEQMNFDAESKCWWLRGTGWMRDFVTHWMPTPQPPRKEE